MQTRAFTCVTHVLKVASRCSTLGCPNFNSPLTQFFSNKCVVFFVDSSSKKRFTNSQAIYKKKKDPTKINPKTSKPSIKSRRNEPNPRCYLWLKSNRTRCTFALKIDEKTDRSDIESHVESISLSFS